MRQSDGSTAAWELAMKDEFSMDRIRVGGMSLEDLYPEAFPKPGDACSFCGHACSEHRDGDCRGKPLDPRLDAGGECPCNGFVPRGLPT